MTHGPYSAVVGEVQRERYTRLTYTAPHYTILPYTGLSSHSSAEGPGERELLVRRNLDATHTHTANIGSKANIGAMPNIEAVANR